MLLLYRYTSIIHFCFRSDRTGTSALIVTDQTLHWVTLSWYIFNTIFLPSVLEEREKCWESTITVCVCVWIISLLFHASKNFLQGLCYRAVSSMWSGGVSESRIVFRRTGSSESTARACRHLTYFSPRL